MSLIEAQGRVRAEGVLVARRSWLHSLELEVRVAMVGGSIGVRNAGIILVVVRSCCES